MYYWMHFNKRNNVYFDADTGANKGGANESGNGEQGDTSGGAGGTGSEGEKDITFSPEQQKKLDDIINARIAKVKAKAETDAAERLRKEQEKAEIEKLQGAEKLKKERELFEKEKAEHIKTLRKQEAAALLKASNMQIDVADEETTAYLADIVTGENLEGTKKNIESLQKIINLLVQKGVDGKLGESAGGFKGNPGANKGDDVNKDKLSDEEWRKRYAEKKTTQ